MCCEWIPELLVKLYFSIEGCVKYSFVEGFAKNSFRVSSFDIK